MGVFLMTELTNKERLIELKGLIVGLDKNFTEFKDDSKEDDIRKWKQINKNAQNISGIKGASGVIAVVISFAINIFLTYFGKHV